MTKKIMYCVYYDGKPHMRDFAPTVYGTKAGASRSIRGLYKKLTNGLDRRDPHYHIRLKAIYNRFSIKEMEYAELEKKKPLIM